MVSWSPPQPMGKECSYCGEIIHLGERCVERFRGVLGVGEKSGAPLVVDDKYDPDATFVLHEDCEKAMLLEDASSGEPMKFCEGCGAKFQDDDF